MKETALTETRPMTVEEYVEFEERSEIRHEFIENQLIPMPGTTDDHNEICFNIKTALKRLLQGLRIYTESVKTQIEHNRDYTYPDVMVAPDPRDEADKYIKKYPSVIVEVMSKTSRMDDMTDKFIRYKSIGSLQNYLLVDSEKTWVEVRHKTPKNQWESTIYQFPDQPIPIPALGIELKMTDIYEGIKFP